MPRTHPTPQRGPFEDKAPPFDVTFKQGDDGEVSERVVAQRSDYGNGRIELEFEDGRHVTVRPEEIVEVS